MAAKAKRSWREKLADSKDFPRLEAMNGKMAERFGKGSFVIPAPLEVDALMRQVPKGKLTTINDLREVLARRHKAVMACPICTGIFATIAARAADESESAGTKNITPYWRTLKLKGELNPKYPGGIENIATRLRAEGHKIVQKGKRYFIVDYEKSLAIFGE